jgi:manganese/iron transport system permease protein/iron/zinc/copper transport system permease protein
MNPAFSVISFTLVAGAALFLCYKPLLATTHNRTVAAAHGVRARAMEILFNALLAMVVVTALRVLGVLLVAATLLIPAATAATTFRSFFHVVLASTGMGLMFAALGLFVSFHRNIASGPAIVLVGAAVFALNLVLSPGTGRRRGVSSP